MMNLLTSIASDTIDRFSMFDENDIVVVGVSGGADSIALLHYLKFYCKVSVMVCHINHKLRGDESYRDMNFVNDICTKWDIPSFIREVDVALFARDNSIGLEEAGRFLRYSEFEFIASQHNATKIATAHTLSDTAETMLLNLTRGTGLQGLCGIPPVRENIIRPFIDCTREQVEEYCLLNSLEFVSDSSNFTDDFARNNIRNNVVPILKEINPAFMTAISHSTTLLNQDNNFINKEVSDCLFFCSELSFGCYDVSTLPSKDIAIRSRAISSILTRHNVKKSFYLINAIDRMIVLGRGKENISNDKFIQVRAGMLNFFNSQDNVDYFEILLPKLIEYSCQNPFKCTTPWEEQLGVFMVDKKNIDKIEKINKNELYILLDYDKIEGSALIRQRIVGDKVRFSHRKGTKSLKKLFIDEKLSALEKSKVLVLADDIGVLAVGKFGVSSRAAISVDTVNFLVVRVYSS